MERSLHISRDGQQFGPYKESTAREHLASGALKATDNAWYSGADGWKPLKEVLDGAQSPAPAAPPPPQVSKIRVNRNGQEIGPYTREKAMEYFTAGQLLPTDMAWDDTSSAWKPLNEVLGLPQVQPPVVFQQQPARPRKRPGAPISESTKLILMGAGVLLVLSIIARWVPFIANIMGIVCLFGGLGLILGYQLVLLFRAFETSVLWGLGCLCLGVPTLVFIILHWEDTKDAFFGILTGYALWFIFPILF